MVPLSMTPNACSRRLLLVAALAVPAATVAASPLDLDAQEPPTFVDAYISGPLDSIYNAEYQRLGTLCQGEPESCWADNLDTTAVALAPLWFDAEATARQGSLSARLRTSGQWPYAALLASGSDGRVVTVLEDMGDWGYGLTMPVRSVQGERFQPWLLSDLDAWLPLEGGPGFGVVDGPYGLEGRLWYLPATQIPAAAPGGEPTVLPDGVYMILAVDGGLVRLRAEIPQDMPCGDEVEPVPASEPEVHVIPVGALLDEEGRPRVNVAYGRGC